MRILISDGDAASRRKLESLLRKDGYDVVAVSDGTRALEMFEGADAPLLAILDVLMPNIGGVEVCRRVRRMTHTISPYIILLAPEDSKEDLVEGLKAGADDYVLKPYDQDEMSARVGVGNKLVGLQLRLAERVQELEGALSHVRQLQGPLRGDTQTYEFGPFRLEAAERRLLREGQVVWLTAKVFDLLLLLVQNSGHLVEKSKIMKEVWQDSEIEDNNLTVSMSVLRKILGSPGSGREYIQTVPKRGYRFVALVRRTS